MVKWVIVSSCVDHRVMFFTGLALTNVGI
jgi:hypothetical protein